MKKELLKYISGLCQATSAALLAGGIIMQDVRTSALMAAFVLALAGAGFVFLRETGGDK